MQGSLGVDRQCGDIVLVIFRQVGIGIGKLWDLELVGVGKSPWVVRLCRYLPPRHRALPTFFFCVLRGPSCWPG